ncbi:MAG: hypothetical protein H7263_01645 [Candidatus Sericytochromatia bacterium]|nr:hypothetical protein [Candidatus Sericytochromatia bacterium]
MSGVNGIRLSGLTLNIKTEAPQTNNQNVKLKGIAWNNNISRPADNLNTDSSNVKPRNSGNVPATSDVPMLFPDDSTQTQESSQSQEPEQTQQPHPKYATSKANEGMKTGIGMAIGGVAGALIGNYFGKGSGTKLGLKLGIGVGVAVGGYIGNRYEK